eukprot:1145508-Amphidinium_carterae.3
MPTLIKFGAFLTGTRVRASTVRGSFVHVPLGFAVTSGEGVLTKPLNVHALQKLATSLTQRTVLTCC